MKKLVYILVGLVLTLSLSSCFGPEFWDEPYYDGPYGHGPHMEHVHHGPHGGPGMGMGRY